MDRNNGRYINNRRQSSTNNNSQHMENHHHHHHHSAASQFSSPTTISYSSQSSLSREPLTQNEELIRYIREAWTNVNEQGMPVVYRNESDQLKNFKPFNLEEYWGQRHVQNIHVAHGHQ